MDEKGFLMGISIKVKIIVFKHDSVAKIQDDSWKLVSALKCVSADEHLLFTFLIFEGKIQQKKWLNNLYNRNIIALNEKG